MLTPTTFRVWTIVGAAVLVAGIVAAWCLGCKTPEILIDHTNPPCGQWPVECPVRQGEAPACCWEENACRVDANGKGYCEFMELAGVHLDAGASE